MQRLKLLGDFEIICVYWLLGCVGSCWSFDFCIRFGLSCVFGGVILDFLCGLCSWALIFFV
jgi:hypothetical protein